MRSLIHVVREHAEHRGDQPCFWWLSRRHGEVTRTWREVVDGAARAAAALRALDVTPGDRVVLIGTHHPDFYASWLGAAWLGAVPTVLAEPGVRIHRQVYAERLSQLVARIRAKVIAFDPRIDGLTDFPLGFATRTTTYDALASSTAAAVDVFDAAPDATLLLQHSSGTTGLQKGVQLSHHAVLAHAESYARATEMTSSSIVATWLPLYHDMGFVACFLGPLLAGASVAWLSPFEWVAAPQMLLEAVARFRATHIWLPNFAFHFLAQRTRQPPDVSSLTHVVNCSEVVTAEAMDAFRDRFASHGLREQALSACYAMAENVFAVTTSTTQAPPRRLVIDRAAFRDTHIAKPASPGAASSDVLTHVSSGTPVDGVTVRIAADDGRALPPRHAGRVLIHSSFLFTGYFERDDLNGTIFDRDGFFDTGDLGYVDDDGHLYVTGRRKDVIIAAGKNIYPQDIEAIADQTDGVHPGRCVSFGVRLRDMGTDGVVLLAESDAPKTEWPEIARRLRATVTPSLDIDLADVKIVARQQLRKSTSGKLARSGNREWYLEGRFGAPPPHVLLGDS